MIQFQSFLTFYALAKNLAETRSNGSLYVGDPVCDDVAKKIISQTLDTTSICLNKCNAEGFSKIIEIYPKSEFELD
ncbi:hypothetical protein TVAG_121870 [Trichomonas vaginalis G3]|uniref:Uncharacterized protein n=1 Tax=Trichomonas vaginalis (strain ATCC PRA-98 / G3) TaxID=412133 RepID=A2E998_TRIV3|nr:hypothetical protein TVAGG3_0421320 [Trichomonas vaginalis G3]EAY10783.1 hypothetical protein TVAG_121870 [Trichomonas vaginalis G3]KAI5536077.1 hypothetical protein TVAGG3_0421320 [Trichomonas vaginalis G3]|eukprot:XP_001323006.1 hypothetical protein [Trichomonas vaginalis G3]